MNFEKYANEGNHFIYEVMEALNTTNGPKAGRITRAVLHAIRDRIPPIDAIQLGQQLPMAIKGIYFDQYSITGKPVVIRNKKRFLNFIKDHDGVSANRDFLSYEEVVDALQAVFLVLENHISPGQVHQLRNLLHREIIELIEE